MGVAKTTTNTAAYGFVSNLFIPSYSGPYSFLSWCKIPASEAGKFVACGGSEDPSQQGALVRFRSSAPFNQHGFYNAADSPQLFRSFLNDSTPYPLDVWVSHLCIVRDAPDNDLITYRDGVALTFTAADDTYTPPISVSTITEWNFWRWNRGSNGNLHADAAVSLAEFAYWEEELTGADALALVTQRPSEIGKPPVAYYSMESLSDFANKGSGSYADVTLNTPGDFANDDHPYAPLPSGASRSLVSHSNQALGLGIAHTG